jgi:hypothetical protein
MELTYYDFAKAVLPDDRIKGVFEPREHPGVDRRQFRDQVDQTLRNSHFVDRLAGHKRMLILVDDVIPGSGTTDNENGQSSGRPPRAIPNPL